MNPVTLAYAAGLVDADGSITLSRSGKHRKFRSPNVHVTNTDINIINFMKHHFGGTIISKRTYREHHTPSFSWSIHNTQAINFLKLIQPYMRHSEKLRRSHLITSQYTSVTPRNGKYTEEMTHVKLAFEYNFFHPSAALN
jgi:hypothetical protein